MPWSAWIEEDYANYPLDYTRKAVDGNLLTGTRSVSPGYTGSAETQWSSQNVDGVALVVTSLETAVVYTVDPAYETDYVAVPNYVGNLEYGVEWDANPDTGEYVEYEPGGLVTLDHWSPPTLGTLSWDNDASPSSWAQPTADGQIRVDLVGSDLSVGWPAYGAGTNLAQFTTNAVTGSVALPSTAPDMPGTQSLAVMVRDELNHPATIPPSGNVVWRRTVGENGLRDATPRGRMPRFRYWIPGPAVRLPLRQRQRDDGLGLSGTPRWRGSASRQASNRWAGYL